jgi:hypothetical protein
MKRSSWVVLAVICLLLIGLIYVRVSNTPKMSPREQINLLLEKGKTAIEEKDLKAAISCVSKDYSDPAGLRFDTLRLQAIQAFRAEGRYRVLLENTDIQVEDDAAVIKTDVSIALGTDDAKMHQMFADTVTLTLRKEKSKRWLVMPVENWKVISFEGLPGEFTE